MFKEAVSKMMGITRPIMFISRNYNSNEVIPGLATLFFINDSGCALTCKHVAEQMLQADEINIRYNEFKEKVKDVKIKNPHNYKKEIRILERQYGFQYGVTVNAKINLRNVPSPWGDITIHMHPEYDLAIIKFENYTSLNYQADNIILLEDENEIQPGKSLCRLGFPFPEFGNYKYNETTDDIEWTDEEANVPAFPIDGIVTRHLGNERGCIYGIELSTPGLRGQSGGALFDREGRIYGVQFATNHLHLGFDMERVQINVNGERKTITNQPFLHVGQCIHIRVIKEFLDKFNIPYITG